jgi:hypothetical protein
MNNLLQINNIEGHEEALRKIVSFARENTYSDFYRGLPNPDFYTDIVEMMSHILPVTLNNLREYTQAGNLLHYPEPEVRYMVSEFTNKHPENLFLIPQRVDTIWESVDREIEKNNPTVATLLVQMFWQMGPMFYRTCRNRKVPVAVLAHRNLPVAVQVAKEVQSKLVVTTPSIAGDLQKLMAEEGLDDQIKSWTLIVPFGEKPTLPNLQGNVTVEYHLFPGIPIGYADHNIQKNSAHSMKVYDDFLIEVKDSKCFITSLVPHAFPFIRFSPDIRVEASTYE